jgi:hypothetical protein
MAGSDQSVNLGGMLSGIGDTIGGMSAAGKGYNDAFINAFRPEIDPSSPESLQAAAEWASNNGRADEAAAYRKEANSASLLQTQLATKEKQRVLGGKVQAAMGLAQQSAEAGDKEGLDRAQKQLLALMQDPNTPLEAQDQIRSASEAVRSMTTQTLGNRASNQAQGAMKLAAVLEDEAFLEKAGPEKAAQLEAQLNRVLSVPETLDAYNAQVEQQAAMDTAKLTAQTQAETQQVEAEMQRLVQGGKLDEAIEFASQSKYPDLVKPYLDLAKSRQEFEKASIDAPGAAYDFRLTDAKKMAESLERYDGAGFESGSAEFLDAITRIEEDQNMSRELKASELAKLRGQMFQKDKELSRTAFSVTQQNESNLRQAEAKAAGARPSKDEIKALKVQQQAAIPYGRAGRLWFDQMSDVEMRNAYADVQRANQGMPTAHYVIDNGAIQFDERGQPLKADTATNGYRRASEIGTDISARPTPLAVSTEDWNILKADGANMADYRLDTALDAS